MASKIKRDLATQYYRKMGEDAFFIQIGANDGVMCDPISAYIKKFRWKGILVEPLPFYFNKLKENYRGFDNLTFENCFIGINNKPTEIFYIDPAMAEEMDGNSTEGSGWAHGQGSFKREIVIDQIRSNSWRGYEYQQNIEDYINSIKSVKVPTLTLNALAAKYAVRQLDLLQIDAQGYDYSILLALNFRKLRPRAIIFESIIACPEREACFNKLGEEGYKLSTHSFDTFAIYSEPDKSP